MPKKCPPGVFCIENITLGMMMIALIILGYFLFVYTNNSSKNPVQIINKVPAPVVMSNHDNIFENAMEPPLSRNPHAPNAPNTPHLAGDVRGGIPVNIKTRPTQHHFDQVGILTKPGSPENLILPLMGRLSDTARDKWEFYTISNTGSVNTRLPVSFRGKNCSSEYGCEDIMNGDEVYVEGYNNTFKVTKYGNSNFRYIPAI